MTNPNTDCDERVRQVRERYDRDRKVAQQWEQYGSKPPEYLADIDYLLSLLDGQAAGKEASEVAADIVREWSERDMNESYNSNYLAEEFGAGHLEERIAAAINDAATRMRDACVAKIRERRDKFQAAANSSSLPNDLTASRDAAVAVELTRLLGELQSLTLDQEQEKQKS